MAQRSKFLYSFLEQPIVYLTVQRLFKADQARHRFLQHVAARDGDRILDIGCGPATILRELPKVEYIGFEPNAAYVDNARQMFGARGSFHAGFFDKAAADKLPPIDIALVKAVLHHMSDTEVRSLFDLLARVIKPSGRVVTIDPVFVTGQNPIARLLISSDRGRDVRTADRYTELARGSFANVAGEVLHQSFPPYTRWIMTANTLK